MTVELDEVAQNLKGKPLLVELCQEDDTTILYIGTSIQDSTGYIVQSIEDVGSMLAFYLNQYHTNV